MSSSEEKTPSFGLHSIMSSPYAYVAPGTRHGTFKPHGYGPFTVKRAELVDEIIGNASPDCSVHISGCRGAGKTIMLHEIAQRLVQEQKKVLFLNSSMLLNNEDVVTAVKKLIKSKEEVYVLVDETQANQEAALFVDLLKSMEDHNVTTIGAGISSNTATSYQFTQRYSTAELFLKTNQDLDDEGVVGFFAPDRLDDQVRSQIKLLLCHIRNYVGGHIFPLMWLAEKLVPKLIPDQQTGSVMTTAAVQALLESTEFQREIDFQRMVDRIMPTDRTDIRCLFYNQEDRTALSLLRRKGLLSDNDKILSYLLLVSIVARTSPKASIAALTESLLPGVAGVRQLFSFALPHLDWSMYNGFGGPTEDALTHEVIVTLYKVPTLTAKIFNPKLVDAGTAARRPDMFLNSTVNTFVECVLAPANNASTVLDIERRMRRFLGANRRYNIGNKDYAILIFQEEGQLPIPLQYLDDKEKNEPMTAQMRGDMQLAYQERVFTFLMQTRAIYLGNQIVVEASQL